MPGKKRGKSTTASTKKSSGKKGGSTGKKKKGTGSKKGKSKEKLEKKVLPGTPDPFSAAAMLNAYYIAHGPVEFLAFRGYTWPGGAQSNKKKGKKKK